MIQDPNPIDDTELEMFHEWLDLWRNGEAVEPCDCHDVRAFLKNEDLMRIWLEGCAAWHRKQMDMCPPIRLFEYHSKELKNTLEQLEKMPDFHPTYLMR